MLVLKLTPPPSPSTYLYDCTLQTLQLPPHTHADLSTFASLWQRISLQIHIHGEFICLFINLTITTILNTTKFVCSTLTATKLQSYVFKTSPLLLNSSHKISYYPVLCYPFQLLCQFPLLFSALIVFFPSLTTHSFNKYLLSNHCMPDTAGEARDTTIDKTDKINKIDTSSSLKLLLHWDFPVSTFLSKCFTILIPYPNVFFNLLPFSLLYILYLII